MAARPSPVSPSHYQILYHLTHQPSHEPLLALVSPISSNRETLLLLLHPRNQRSRFLWLCLVALETMRLHYTFQQQKPRHWTKLIVLADNGRLRHVDTIAKRYSDLTMAHRGEVKAIVTTVIPLPTEEEKELKETLQEILGKGKTVKLEQKVKYDKFA